MSQDRQKRKEELNFKYQEALDRFQQNPSNVTKLEIDKLKLSEIESLFDEKVEGIIFFGKKGFSQDIVPVSNILGIYYIL